LADSAQRASSKPFAFEQLTVTVHSAPARERE
jgi:hypothetical protein